MSVLKFETKEDIFKRMLIFDIRKYFLDSTLSLTFISYITYEFLESVKDDSRSLLWIMIMKFK